MLDRASSREKQAMLLTWHEQICSWSTANATQTCETSRTTAEKIAEPCHQRTRSDHPRAGISHSPPADSYLPCLEVHSPQGLLRQPKSDFQREDIGGLAVPPRKRSVHFFTGANA